MEKVVLYQQESQYRDDFRVRGFRFGSGRKALAVVGSMRGNEHQQLYACAQLVRRLQQLEADGHLVKGNEILVIPCANPWSMNIRKRFWTIDNTDINRMFPGYSEGETTQRIAAGIFNAVKDYEMGVQFASFYMRGSFAPHIRIMRTGFEDIERAKQFGIPYVIVRNPRPFDTTTLNYNWQIWETSAFSLYTTDTERVDRESAADAVDAILHFMRVNGLVGGEGENGTAGKGQTTAVIPADAGASSVVRVVSDDDLVTVRTKEAGFFHGEVRPGYPVSAGEEMAQIEDPYDGHIRARIVSPVSGSILFMHDEDMCYADSAVYKIISNNNPDF